ncbi:hypothetical protein [Mixta mediterraneensis]|uniref:hypothetical protein n=1 Tax=Mixta mediterraneensis TaxID=2758443 RepID=UPI001EEF5DCA|nr:hypothetical protein [Mixta mediterraneensis]
MTEHPERLIGNTGHRRCNQSISQLDVSNTHEVKMAILCLQGGVYYAFFKEDERPNFEQLARKDQRNRAHEDVFLYLLL